MRNLTNEGNGTTRFFLDNFVELDEATSYHCSGRIRIFVYMAAPNINARAAVLNILQAKEIRPLELLRELGDQGYSDSEVKQAISELLHEAAIRLTSDRILRAAVAA